MSSIKLSCFRSLCEKMTWMCTYFKTETDVAQNLINDSFLTLTVRGTFQRKDFKWKKIREYEVNFLKNAKFVRRTFMQNYERAEEATSGYSVTNDFLQYIYSVLVAKNHQKITAFSSLIFFRRYFLTILIMVPEQLYWRKILCGCFRFMCLWVFVAIKKRCPERCALQLYFTSWITENK